MARYAVEEEQRGLQRVKWIEMQAKKAKELAKAEAKLDAAKSKEADNEKKKAAKQKRA